MAFAVPDGILGAEITNHFEGVYDRTNRKSDPKLQRVMQRDIPSEHRMETHAIVEAAPHIELWIDQIPEEGLGAKTVAVVNHKFGKRIKIKREDIADEMTGNLAAVIGGLARSTALLDERFFFDVSLSQTNTLPATVTAIDGAAVHAATDGDGADRFGVSGGNVQSGGGVATSAAVRADFWKVRGLFRKFEDGKGQFYYEDSMLESFTIVYGADNEEVFREAFMQGRTHEASGAAVTNTVLESELEVVLWSTPRITDNDWFVYVTDAPQHSVFSQLREGLEQKEGTVDNSDTARDSDIEYTQVRIRKAAGCGLPIDTVKVNN